MVCTDWLVQMTVTKTAASGNRGRVGRSTREAILEAASRLIHVHGYNHTSLDDVLRESGVGKANFYYHFKSKEELGYGILDQIIASFLVAALEGAILLTKLTKDIAVMEQCVAEMKRYLSIYEHGA